MPNGASANSAEVPGIPTAGNAPATPTGLMAAATSGQVALTWNASAGATSYKVGRALTTGGPYTNIASPVANSYTDASVTNGTTYYYVVAASNASGTSSNSSEVSAVPSATSAAVNVTVDVMSNRHPIQPYIYAGAFPKDTTTITDSGTGMVRWGGNAASTYNWKLFTYNADNDYFFEDFTFCGLGLNSMRRQRFHTVHQRRKSGGQHSSDDPGDAAVGGAEPGNAPPPNNSLDFSVPRTEPAAPSDPSNTDAWINRDRRGTARQQSVADLAADPNHAYYPLLDGPPPGGRPGQQRVSQSVGGAMATAFGATQHFYDMDNEIDIWGGTHVDIHPNGSGYNELRDTI